MLKLLTLSALLAGGAAYAQATEPTSNQASNILNGSPAIAKQLPAPQAANATVGGLLDAAATALMAGHTGEAQEALEEAETQELDRSVPYNDYKQAIADPVITAIYQARQALGTNDVPGALRSVAAAQAAAKGA